MLEPAPILPLTDNCHHYTRLYEVPWDIQKYWKRRFDIFDNYNDGIYLTDDAWFGVTPQPVARKIAEYLPLPAGVRPGHGIVVDMFAGAGGNTIAFALSGRWRRVIAIERDADTLACAQSNAAVAGVPEDAITWVHGDCFAVLPQLLATDPDADSDLDASLRCSPDATVLFASPPWGGVSYTAQAVFDLATMEPYGLQALHDACHPLPHALYLPRTSDLQQLADVLPRRRAGGGVDDETASKTDPKADPKLEVVQYCMHGFSKALVAYYPAADGLLPRAQKLGKTNGVEGPEQEG